MSGSAVGDGASCSPKSEKALITHVSPLDWKKSPLQAMVGQMPDGLGLTHANPQARISY